MACGKTTLIKDPARRHAAQKAYYNAHAEEKRARTRAWVRANPEKKKEHNRSYRERHREELRLKSRSYSERRRLDSGFRSLNNKYMLSYRLVNKMKVLRHYGGEPPSCACCGESIPEFLSLDHIDNNGAKHRSENKLASGAQTYSWLIKNGYPDGFQVLCMNCNTAKAHAPDHVCPHKRQWTGTQEKE